jgi:predicted cupin superfamily sugar epimerase
VDAEGIIELLDLTPHPEGGHYRETWRGPDGPDGRATATAIYFLLRTGERSHWHRVDASEVWLHHAGGPLRLSIDDEEVVLGTDLASGQRPQAIVPAGAWQAAESTGGWTLVSCVVAPGFGFDGFELAPPGWSPVPDTTRGDRPSS